MNPFSLSGRVAAVSGSNRGIGRAIAIGLAEAGADIALLQRSADQDETKREIERMGRKCEIIGCDMADTEQVKAALPEAVRRFGTLDILVNNAGMQRHSPAIDFAEHDWDEVIAVNLKSVFLLCQQAARLMIPQGGGKIINIASLLTFQGGIKAPAYASSKGAVGQLTKALANEWAAQGINVNAIAPGYIATDLSQTLRDDPVRSRQILERIPAGRWGLPEDIGGAAVFLASGASNYVNGHILAVDGGWLGR